MPTRGASAHFWLYLAAQKKELENKPCTPCNATLFVCCRITRSAPSANATRVVRHWIDTNILQHDHRRTAPDNAEEDVVVTGPLKRDVEPETVAIKRQRGGDILNDEEWRNAAGESTSADARSAPATLS